MSNTRHKLFKELCPGDIVALESGGTARVIGLPEKGMLKGHLSVQIMFIGNRKGFAESSPDAQIELGEQAQVK